MGELEAQVEDLSGQVLMLQDMVLRMNCERASCYALANCPRTVPKS